MFERWVGMKTNVNIPYASVTRSLIYAQTCTSLVINFAK